MRVRFARFSPLAHLTWPACALMLEACNAPDATPSPSSEMQGGTAGASGSVAASGATTTSGGGANAAGASAGSSTTAGAGSASQGGSAGDAGSGGATAGGGKAGSAGSAGASHFSFFVTSVAALRRLSGSQDGFGGDLRFKQANGLAGADEICRVIADTSLPGNAKTWRAFLSATKGPDGKPVNAIDRIGEGPWYDRRGRLFTMNKQGLLQTRPQGADPIIINDLPNEDGVPNHNPDGTGDIDNHNFLTGSSTLGVLNSMNPADTCQDWTSSAPDGGKPRCGVTWPRVQFVNWIYALSEGGCAPGATPPGADQGSPGTVGALGGYGGFYCFALTP